MVHNIITFFVQLILVPLFMAYDFFTKTTFGYYTGQSMILGIWVYTVIYAWSYFFSPVIAAYGFWSMIGTIIVVNIASFASSLLFFSTSKPKGRANA